jgi:hypothetical protein
MPTTSKKTLSWGWIIFWIFIFWPVGLFLLLRRFAVDKSAVLRSVKAITVVSYILMGLGVIYLLISFADNNRSVITAAIIFGGGGILINRFAKKTKLTGERYKKYISLVVNQNQSSIDNIASAIGIPYETAVKDLQKMINIGYFTGAYIDVAQRDIVLAKPAPQQIIAPSAATVGIAHERVVTCGSCGANNKVIGQIGECEFCGSYLQ